MKTYNEEVNRILDEIYDTLFSIIDSFDEDEIVSEANSLISQLENIDKDDPLGDKERVDTFANDVQEFASKVQDKTGDELEDLTTELNQQLNFSSVSESKAKLFDRILNESRN